MRLAINLPFESLSYFHADFRVQHRVGGKPAQSQLIQILSHGCVIGPRAGELMPSWPQVRKSPSS